MIEGLPFREGGTKRATQHLQQIVPFKTTVSGQMRLLCPIRFSWLVATGPRPVAAVSRSHRQPSLSSRAIRNHRQGVAGLARGCRTRSEASDHSRVHDLAGWTRQPNHARTRRIGSLAGCPVAASCRRRRSPLEGVSSILVCQRFPPRCDRSDLTPPLSRRHRFDLSDENTPWFSVATIKRRQGCPTSLRPCAIRDVERT